MMMTDSGPITITEESVRKEGEEIIAADRELSARKERFVKLAEFLRAAGREDWIPAAISHVAKIAPRGPMPASSGTWASEMLKEMEAYPDGIALIDLLAVMKDGPLAERARQNRNGIYNAASKLEQIGQIVKHNGRVFLPHHFEEFRKRLERGEVEDYKRGPVGGRTAADILTDFISSQPQGLETSDIVKAMSAEGIAPGTVYNNLSKVVSKGRVRREGKLYLPLKDEAPTGEPEGAS